VWVLQLLSEPFVLQFDWRKTLKAALGGGLAGAAGNILGSCSARRVYGLSAMFSDGCSGSHADGTPSFGIASAPSPHLLTNHNW